MEIQYHRDYIRGTFRALRFAAALGISLAATIAAAMPTAVAAKTIQPGEPMSAQAVKEMTLTEDRVGQFLDFLKSREETSTLTKEQAQAETARFIKPLKNKRVLADLALAARMNLNIYTMMPKSDKELWEGLYSNCLRKMGSQTQKDNEYLLGKFNCPMQRKAQYRYSQRSGILGSQSEAHQILNKLLHNANSINIRAGRQNERGLELATQLLKPITDTDVLTELAGTLGYKRHLYEPFEGSNFFFELFLECGQKISDRPQVEALDALDFLYTITSGGAASSEFLDQFKAHALGLTMEQYMERRRNHQR